ncbi:MAG: LysR family transcriptional regulator [SAR202 cluster bacterium]|nr:LysR family transcriptional regulator [SAR202 cluster bacterium]
MELRELISFYHVARLRSVSKAARALELGQPTVTTHLRKLEDEFAITLFDRIKRPIQLTSEGVTLLELVTPVVTSVDALKTQMNYAEQRGSFVVGAYPDLVTHHLPIGIQMFRKDYPDVRIRLLARSYNPLIQLVRSGEIDLAFCSSPPADDASLEFQELFNYNTVLLTPPGHELVHRQPIKLEDLAAWPLILTAPESLLRQRVEQAFKERGLGFEVVLALDDTESMKRYVEIGMGVAIGSDFTLRQEDHHRFGVVSLGHLFPGSVIGVCTLKGKFAGQAVKNFVEMMSGQMRGYHAELELWVEESKAEARLAEVGSRED